MMPILDLGEGKSDRIAVEAVRQHPRFCSLAIGFGIIEVKSSTLSNPLWYSFS
ncbi:hypothetical protein F383_01839 [Gossypium arboreum]|uniref:Uncharacterized protein n=1 Tax=Gossypium arboreum TaxID=29729 RepID=A0A0B0PG96_GOSAR|nr:hypothetical protein F383_01839 [Gossypium arboreum]